MPIVEWLQTVHVGAYRGFLNFSERVCRIPEERAPDPRDHRDCSRYAFRESFLRIG